MRKNLKMVMKVIGAVAAIVSTFYFFYNISAFSANPLAPIELSGIHSARLDDDGNFYIIDSGSSRIIKTDSSGNVSYQIYRGADFFFAVDITFGDGDLFYVHELVSDEGGIAMAYERLLAFDKESGDFHGVIYEYVYDYRQTVSSIRSIAAQGGRLWFIKTDNSGISLMYAYEDVGYAVSHFEPFPNAVHIIQDADISADGVYLLDKAGEIMVLRDGVFSTLYTAQSGDNVEEFSLPFSISANGAVYFADIGTRSIAAVDESGRREIIPADLSIDFSERAIYYNTFVMNDLVIFTSYDTVYVADSNGEIINELSVLTPGRSLLVYRLSLLLALVIMAVCVLYILVKALISLKFVKLSQQQQISIVVIVVAVLISIFILPGIMQRFEDDAKAELVNRLSTLTQLSQEMLDREAIVGIRNPQCFNNEYYQRTMASLRRLVDDNQEWNSNIYIDLYRLQGDNIYSIAYHDGIIGAFFTYGLTLEGSDIEYIIESGGEFVTNLNIVDISGAYMAVTGPVFDPNDNIIGGIEIGLDLEAFNESMAVKTWGLLVSIILTVVMLIFFILEGMDAIFTFASRLKIRERFNDVLVPIPFIRALAFILAIAVNLTTGFLPIYASRFSAEQWGISPELSAALPISANLIFMAATSLLCAGIMRRIGMKKVFLIGAILCAAGDSINAIALSFPLFVAGMSLAGIGAGLIFSFVNIYIASLNNVSDKSSGFAMYNSATFSGINCGILLGAVLATSIGQSYVFFFCAALWLISLLVFYLVVNKNTLDKLEIIDKKQPLFKIITRRRISLILILTLVYVTLDGMLYFFVPVFSESIGLLETEISLIFIIHALGIMFVGPLMIKKLESLNINHIQMIRIAMYLSVASLLLVAFRQEMMFILPAVLILGCSNSIGYTYLPLYLSEMDEAKDYGADNVMSVYGTIENVGGAVGPIIFGWALAFGTQVSFMMIAVVALFSLVLLFFTEGKVMLQKR